MKTHPVKSSLVLGLAALTANADPNDLGLAACSFEVNTDAAEPWQQILPGQDFSAKDGRPNDVPGKKWRINDKSGELLAAKLNARAADGQKLLFDYEHQTLLSEKNGQKAPASGRGQKFEWRQGQGLFAQLKYTPIAKKHVENGEYEFFSPVVMYDKATGNVIDLHSVALTNDPAVLGMQAAAALKQQSSNNQTEHTMHPLLVRLLATIGITADPEKHQDFAALSALLDSDDAKTAMAALTAKLAEHGTQQTEIAALKAQGNEVDISKYVPVETYNNLVGELAALKSDHKSLTVDQTIEQAQKDGKFIAASELDYLTQLGNTHGVAALKATLDARPVVAAFNGNQSNHKPDDKDKTGVAALTADHKLVADQLGISHEDYAKQLATETA